MFRRLISILNETEKLENRKDFKSFKEKVEKLIKEKRGLSTCKFLTFGTTLSLHEFYVLNSYLQKNYNSEIKRVFYRTYLIQCKKDYFDDWDL